MKFNLSALTFSALLVITISSCKNREFKDIDQGEIHFSITYGGAPGTIPVEMMPKTLVVSFKKDRILFDINSPFGNSGISNLANHQSKTYDTYVNLFGSRYFYSGVPEETPPGLATMEGLKISKTGRKTDILSFNCEEAEISLPSMPDSVFYVWYTNDIDIKKPNAANPFREIDGVLLKFFFFMGEREFVFEAEGIYRKDIPDKAFTRRERHREVPKEVISEYIIRMVNL